MLGDFFRKSTYYKQRVNKRQNVEIDSSASSGGQGKCMKCVSFSCPRIEAALSVLKVSLFSFLKTIFEKEVIGRKELAF
jgi:hypothetical protein